jgi:hypothetical protein
MFDAARGTTPVFYRLALTVLAVVAGAHSLRAQDWTSYRLGEVRFEVPSDWTVLHQAGDRDISFESPAADYQFDASWWFPDEPLLGYDDIVFHSKTEVAGRRATYIHSVFPTDQTLTVALDEPRADGYRLLLRLSSPTHDFHDGSPVLDDILARVRFGGPEKPKQPSQQMTKPRPPGGRPAPFEVQVSTSFARQFGNPCEPVDLATFDHPTRGVIESRPEAHLLWLMLCGNRTYPVFGIDFDYDPQGATGDFFRPFFVEMLKANGRWSYSIAVPRDKLVIDVARQGKNGVSVDYRTVP